MREQYLALMDRTFDAYGEDGIRRFFERVRETGLREHGFPRVSANLAILIAHGYRTPLFSLMVEMMDFCCREIPHVSRAGNDFSVKEIVFALLELERAKLLPRAQTEAWRQSLAGIDPYACYQVIAPAPDKRVGNWAAFNAAGEWMRQYAGLCDATDFLNLQLASQLLAFDENGMYRDPHEPMLYDVMARVQLAVLLHFGYHGRHADALRQVLRRGIPLTLRMQSVTGELPYGGRSNQFLYNEAALAAYFEWSAAELAATGDADGAGQCKAAAQLAVREVERMLERAVRTHVKNQYPARSGIGCEKYAYFDKYMVTLASNLYLAWFFADEGIVPTAAPTLQGGYAAETSPHFHKVFLNREGYFLEFDLHADPQYDGSGLGRIHRRGIPSPLILSCPFPGADAHYGIEPPNAEPFAIGCARVVHENGEKQLLSGAAHGVYSLQSATEDGVRLLCRIGDTSVTETYIVTEEGVTVTVSADSPVAILFPVFRFDGQTETEITASAQTIAVRLDGYVCRYRTDGCFERVGEIGNRNGRYVCYRASGENCVRLFIHAEQE